MIFEKDGTIVTLDSPAQYPYKPETEFVQAKDKSASGITHVESFEVKTNTFTYNFMDMSESDYIKIMEWYVNTAEAMLHKFNLTDDFGSTRTVRFSSNKIGFDSNTKGLWNGSFTVEEEQ